MKSIVHLVAVHYTAASQCLNQCQFSLQTYLRVTRVISEDDIAMRLTGSRSWVPYMGLGWSGTEKGREV